MGALVTMRPDLASAVLLGVPFVDVLTTMLDETIPLTSIEVTSLRPRLKPGHRYNSGRPVRHSGIHQGIVVYSGYPNGRRHASLPA